MRAVRDQEGAVTAIVPEAVEVTERRRAEEALRQSQKMESIGQLTGGVAHDFNNLLAIVIGNLETLRRRLGSEPLDGANLRRLTDNSMVGAQRAASLTQRLLAFARRQPLDPKPIDVGRLIVGMGDLLHRAVGETIRLETRFAEDLWRVNIDSNQLEVAILNLAVNARDAMPHGGRVEIEAANVEFNANHIAEDAAPGAYVRIIVRDDGVGMRPETIARAFEPSPCNEGRRAWYRPRSFPSVWIRKAIRWSRQD